MDAAARRTGPPVDLPPTATPAGAVPPRRLGGASVDVAGELLTSLQGACGTVTVELDDRIEAGRDWWPLALTWTLRGLVPALPAVVARPGTVEEVSAVLALCSAHRVPVTAFAGRSGVCGASVPAFGGLSLDMRGLGGITDVDDTSLVVDVGAGTFGDTFEQRLRSDHHLTLGHWPQSVALSTVGGWLACRSAGQYSTRYGKIEDMVVGLEVVLADGRVVRTGGQAPRGAVGPDLTQLFVGSEGTLGIITQARLRVHPLPPGEGRRAYGFASFEIGLETCRRILRRGATPAVLRLYDHTESERAFGAAACVLIVLDEGDPNIVHGVEAVVDDECAAAGAQTLDIALVERWLTHRNETSALGALIREGFLVDTIEVAARWSALPDLYANALGALRAIDDVVAASAHESHAYVDGACLYFTWAAHPPEVIGLEEADALYVAAWDAVTRVTLAAGGAISHHHGVGINRQRYVADALGGALGVLQTVKDGLDPRGILNPGKLGLRSPYGEVDWP